MQVLGGAASDTARDAEVNGKPPRILPLTEQELTPEAKDYCKQLRKTLGVPESGLIPGVTATMLRHLDLNDAQTEMGIMLAVKGKISARERGDRLAWIEQALRIEGALDGMENLQFGGAELHAHLVDLFHAHAVLAGDGAADLDAFFQHFGGEFLGAL